jgi:predicted  nucleic acid-binding Zn-ribbon protein
MDWQAIRQNVNESLWVTMAWEWLQRFLGRVVDSVLWVTMIYSGYLLAPGAPQPPGHLSTIMYIAQFVALDVGGLGLYQLAQKHKVARWSFPCNMAYTLIGITLVTITYAGIHHAVPEIPEQTHRLIEITLVVIRAVVTPLYGLALQSLKSRENAQALHIRDLQTEVSTLQGQLSSREHEVSRLRVQLDSKEQEVGSLHKHLDSKEHEVSRLRVQLDSQGLELADLRERYATDQRWQQSQVSSLQQEVDRQQEAMLALRSQVQTAQLEAERLRVQVESHKQERERVQAMLVSERQQVSTRSPHLDSKEQEVSRLSVQLDSLQQLDSGQREVSSEQQKVNSGQHKVLHLDSRSRKSGQVDSGEIIEQIRDLLCKEPGLSGRALACRLNISPTTANRWKSFVEHQNAASRSVNE